MYNLDTVCLLEARVGQAALVARALRLDPVALGLQVGLVALVLLVALEGLSPLGVLAPLAGLAVARLFADWGLALMIDFVV
jgi:hypothetical protein